MAHRTPQDLVIDYIAAYNAFDLDGMAALLSRDIRFENHSDGALTARTEGLAAFRQLAGQSQAPFSPREQGVNGWATAEDAIAVDIAYTGTLARDIPGGPAAGTVLALKGRSEFGFADGKITRITDRS